MAQAARESDWRDGFPFVGNQLALDFLNTQPITEGATVELLADATSVARWMAAAGLFPAHQAKRLKKKWSADTVEITAFRESLRGAVIRLENGSRPSTAFVSRLNELLLTHPYTDAVQRTNSTFERVKQFIPEEPSDLLAPLADAVADLLTIPDMSKLRMCDACVLHFYDTSKKGTRRWCSMNMCGNRSKVAAYASRKRSS